MSETVIVRSLTDPNEEFPMDRAEFYREQVEAFKTTGEPTKAADIIAVFIFNSHHELLIQKRSFEKSHNPGLLDKSIGGHIRFGDTPDYAVMVETVQELQVPSVVLRGKLSFEKTKSLLNDYLETIAIIEHHHDDIQVLTRNIDGEIFRLRTNCTPTWGFTMGGSVPWIARQRGYCGTR